MAQSSRSLGLYCLATSCLGVGCVVGKGLPIWTRLLGLQLAAMGCYLFVASQGRRRTARLLLRIRFLIPLGYVIIGGVTGAAWLLIAAGLESICLLWLGWLDSPINPDEPPRSSGNPSSLHNVVLAIVPLAEGLGCLFLPTRYGPLALGLDVQAGEVWATLFGLHTLYLGLAWVVLVAGQRHRTLRTTAFGRIGVGVAFLAFDRLGLAGESSKLSWLVVPLLLSSLWTLIETHRLNE